MRMSRIGKHEREAGAKKKINLKKWQKILIIVLVVALGAGAGAYAYINSKLNKIKKTTIKIEKNEEEELKVVEAHGYSNILLLGTDTRDMNDSEGSRTDCIIIVSINEDTGSVYLTSIYRDTLAKLGETSSYSKINSAFTYGGAKMAIQTVNQTLDLDVTKYFLFNFKAVVDMIDEVGGIELNIEDYEIDEMNVCIRGTASAIGEGDFTYITSTGLQKVDGIQAVAYGRMRYGVGDDFKRTERMRIVVTKLLEKVKTMKYSKISALMDKVFPELETNLTNTEILGYVSRLSRYHVTGTDGFPYNVSTGYLGEASFVFPNDLYGDVIEFHNRVFSDPDYVPTDQLLEISYHIDYLISTASDSSPGDQESENPEEAPVIEEPATEDPTTPDTPSDPSTPTEPEDPGTGGDGGGTTPVDPSDPGTGSGDGGGGTNPSDPGTGGGTGSGSESGSGSSGTGSDSGSGGSGTGSEGTGA